MAVEKAACLAGDPELRGACTDRAAPPVLEPGVLTERVTGNRRVGVAPPGGSQVSRLMTRSTHEPSARTGRQRAAAGQWAVTCARWATGRPTE